MSITITEKAALKVQDYLKQVSDQTLALRVFVKAGGCAGYQFGLKLDKESPTDVVEHRNGVNIVADAKSADLLGDAEIDYVETEMGGGFKFNFPESYLTCGCGHSFIPKGKEQATGARSPEEHHHA
jgi:iron-sulfur cluster assembly protein